MRRGFVDKWRRYVLVLGAALPVIGYAVNMYQNQPARPQPAQAQPAAVPSPASVGVLPTVGPVPTLDPAAPQPTLSMIPTQVPVLVDAVVRDPAVVQLMAELQGRGIEPQPLDPSLIGALQDAPGQGYRLGNGWLHVHVYADAQAARGATSKVVQQLHSPLMDWVDRPHFFRHDRLIVLYLGRDQQVIDALTELCGEPFTKAQP